MYNILYNRLQEFSQSRNSDHGVNKNFYSIEHYV